MTNIFIARGVGAALALAGLVLWQTAAAPFARILEPEPEPEPSILFVGDIMLDRSVAKHARAQGTTTLFASVADFLSQADARVGNLEGSITQNPSIAEVDNTILHFTFSPGLAEGVLTPLNFAALSLANNHAYDFGRSGFDATQDHLEAWGIKPFGNPYNARDLSTAIEVRGRQFCLVGYHSLYDPSTAEVVAEIQAIKPGCYRTIVFAHWGDEYEPVANAAQVAAGHAFVDAGADLVMGAHPHVVQNVEIYKDKAVFYSLGNFMFDQNFSWATTHGLAVKATFGGQETRFVLTPITIKNQQASLSDGADGARILEAAGRLAEFTLP